MRRRKAVDRIIIVLIITILAVTAGFLFTKLKTDKITKQIESGEPVNLLFMVHDSGELIFSDLLIYDTVTGKGALFDIPGNVGSIIDEYKRMDSIDVLFDERKPEPYLSKVSSIVNLDIPYYIAIDIMDFSRLIDLFDGIMLFIPNPVEVLDNSKPVLLPSGNVVLDGVKAVTYMEYTDQPLPSVENISRRQKILQAFFDQLDINSNYLDDKVLVSYIDSYIDTNLKSSALVSFLKIFKKFDTERIVFQRVLGNSRLVGEKTLLFPHYEGKLLRETVKQTIDSLANTDVISADELNITLEILNATTQTGLAGRTSQVFKSFGYDVARIANYSGEDLDNTVVVSRNGDRLAAEKVADIILCDEISYTPGMYFESDIISEAEITIILGKDFDGRYCKK